MELSRNIPATVTRSGIPRAARVYAVNVGMAQTIAIAADPSPQSLAAMVPFRSSLTFHNPGTVDVYFAPATDANGNPIALTVGGAGSFRLPGFGGTWIIDVPGPVQFNCIAAAAGGTLTILEYLS